VKPSLARHHHHHHLLAIAIVITHKSPKTRMLRKSEEKFETRGEKRSVRARQDVDGMTQEGSVRARRDASDRQGAALRMGQRRACENKRETAPQELEEQSKKVEMYGSRDGCFAESESVRKARQDKTRRAGTRVQSQRNGANIACFSAMASG